MPHGAAKLRPAIDVDDRRVDSPCPLTHALEQAWLRGPGISGGTFSGGAIANCVHRVDAPGCLARPHGERPLPPPAARPHGQMPNRGRWSYCFTKPKAELLLYQTTKVLLISLSPNRQSTRGRLEAAA